MGLVAASLKEDLQSSRSVTKRQPLISQLEELTASQTSCLLASLVLEPEELLEAQLPDKDDIDHDKVDTFKAWSTTSLDTDILFLMHLSGYEDLQSRLRTLCMEFADIFSNGLPHEIPFNLVEDDLNWKVAEIELHHDLNLV